jgi:hypothetical protein
MHGKRYRVAAKFSWSISRDLNHIQDLEFSSVQYQGMPIRRNILRHHLDDDARGKFANIEKNIPCERLFTHRTRRILGSDDEAIFVFDG